MSSWPLVVIFLGLRLLPGDPAVVLAGQDASPQTLAAIREANGLNDPLPFQYVVWLKNIVQGNLGVSFFTRAQVSTLIAQRAPATLELGVAGMLLTVLLGIPTASSPPSAPTARATGSFRLQRLAVAVPGFWLGILAILLFSLVLGWLPLAAAATSTSDPVQSSSSCAAAVTLALPGAAGLSRLVKASMLEVLGDDYVRTARAKGVGNNAVVWRHAMRNALVPVATVLGLQFGRLLGGAVITESVFSWPGIGRLIRDSIGNRDYAVVQACLLLLVMLFIVINLLTDITYGVLDPRIRLGGRSSR